MPLGMHLYALEYGKLNIVCISLSSWNGSECNTNFVIKPFIICLVSGPKVKTHRTTYVTI